MKVAYICHRGRPAYGHEEAWFAAMPGVEVKLITTDPPAASAYPNLSYIKVDYREAKGKLFSDSTARRVWYENFEPHLEDVDVIVVLEVFSTLSRQFVDYGRRTGKPVVVLVYELIDTHPIYKLPGYRANTRFVLRHADAFIAVSHAAARHLEKLKAPADKIQVVYPGVDTQRFQPDLTHRDPTGLIFVGPRLGPHKGLDLVINSYRRLAPEFPRLGLTVVGQGGLEAEVKQLAAEYPAVRLQKPVPNAEIPALLNRHSIFMMPARDTRRFGLRVGAEQFGFSLVEAMACGLAVITSDCGALPEIVTSANIVVPQGDVDALYRRTHTLLERPDHIAETGRANRALVLERYSLAGQGSALATTLSQIAARRDIRPKAHSEKKT